MESFPFRILQFLILPGAIIFQFSVVMAVQYDQDFNSSPLHPPLQSPVDSISPTTPPPSPVPPPPSSSSPSPPSPAEALPATPSRPSPSPSYAPPSSPSNPPPSPPYSPPPPPPSPPPSSTPPAPDSQVKALFVLGDSSVGCATNNFLGTFARANRLPYGRDFDTHEPTGRFCNGRIPVDYLALRLGLPFIPSYVGQTSSVEDMIYGVNYASDGAGIIFSSGSELGQGVSLGQQIQQIIDTFQLFTTQMGEERAASFISNSIVYISIGTNDYINYYLPNVSDVQSKYVSWKFSQFLAYSMKEEIKNLYNANVRKVVVMGLAPIGCAPYYLWQYGSDDGACIDKINNMITEFNFVMRYTIGELRKELIGADIIFCDAYQGSMDIIKNFDQYGFSVSTTACCGLGRYNGWMMCMSPDMACEDASSHLWWDQFHPTAAVNEILADNVWSGLHTPMCYPMNMEDMAAQVVR